MFSEIKKKIYKSDSFQKIIELLSEKKTPPLNVGGKGITISNINGSLISFLLDFIYSKGFNKIFYIVSDNEKVNYIKDDLSILIGDKNISAFTPEKSYDNEDTTKSLTLLSENKNFIIISAVDKLSYSVVPKEKYSKSLLHLKSGDEFLFEELVQKLEE